MSKGSNRRPKTITDEQFQENWENIFVRKKTPKHGGTKVHKDKTKYNKKLKRQSIRENMELGLLISLFSFSVLSMTPELYAGDNHVHIEQVGSGDGVTLNIDQVGYGNEIKFSFAHANNVFNLTQHGSGNTISWVPWWGSGKNWGGDVDGTGNNITIEQYDGATYGAHVWGNNNDVDVYQSGDHDTFLDIHADGVEYEGSQTGSGSKYSRVYWYGNTDNSEVSVTQQDAGAHTAYITLQGNYLTDLTLLQQGSTNQSYNLTQSCYTVGGCTVSVTQGN